MDKKENIKIDAFPQSNRDLNQGIDKKAFRSVILHRNTYSNDLFIMTMVSIEHFFPTLTLRKVFQTTKYVQKV